MKNKIYSFLILFGIWMILMAEINWFTMITGILTSVFVIFFTVRFLPLGSIKGVNFAILIFHILFLIKEVYIQGFHVVRLIIKGAQPDVTVVKTELKSEFLKAVLINSITLTPGSIPLCIEGDDLTVLNLSDAKNLQTFDEVNELRKRIEVNLKKAEKHLT